MRRKNCGPKPGIDPYSKVRREIRNVDTAHQFVGGLRCRRRVLWPSPLGLWQGYLLRVRHHIVGFSSSLHSARAPLTLPRLGRPNILLS